MGFIEAFEDRKLMIFYVRKLSYFIHKIINDYSNPKFTKKNHERNENLNEIQLGKWYTGLLGKSTNLISKNSI